MCQRAATKYYCFFEGCVRQKPSRNFSTRRNRWGRDVQMKLNKMFFCITEVTVVTIVKIRKDAEITSSFKSRISKSLCTISVKKDFSSEWSDQPTICKIQYLAFFYALCIKVYTSSTKEANDHHTSK